MKVLNVKSTMLDGLLDVILPHYCCSCGDIGSILCDSCKYDIISDQYPNCLLCGSVSPLRSCLGCNTTLDESWCGGEKTGGLEKLINQYKFEFASAAHAPLGDIVLASLPQLPLETVVVPIPTIRAHVRQRGYDHAGLLSRYIAARRNLHHAEVLKRRTVSVQRGTSRDVRLQQAQIAFKVDVKLKSDVPYLLVDDVVTTGATLRFAAEVMRGAGAGIVWGVAVCRQPLD